MEMRKLITIYLPIELGTLATITKALRKQYRGATLHHEDDGKTLHIFITTGGESRHNRQPHDR